MRKRRCCGNCVYAERLGSRWLRVILTRWPGLLICLNKAGAGGEISEVLASGLCGNFLARSGRRRRIEALRPPGSEVRYIPLTKGKYAIVDAEDYPALSK